MNSKNNDFVELYFECPVCGEQKLIKDNEHYQEDSNVLCDICFNELKHL